MILSERKTKRLLIELNEYSKTTSYTLEELVAAKIIEEQTGIYYVEVLEEGWFTDTLGGMAKGVGKFIKGIGSAGSAAASGQWGEKWQDTKYAWAKDGPELYGQGTHKFWEREEIAKKAHEQFKDIQSALDKKFDGEFKETYEAVKSALADAENAEKGELGFPNQKKTSDFYLTLFGLDEWEKIETELQKIESGNMENLELGGVFGNMLMLKLAMQSSLDTRTHGLETVEPRRKEFNERLAGMRKLLQKYAQDTKEIYQTFENKLYNRSLLSLILETVPEAVEALEGDDADEKEEAVASLEAALKNSDAISDSQLQSLQKSSSPLNMLIAAVVMGVFVALMDNINDNAYNEYVKKVSEQAKSPKEVIKVVAQELKNTFSINDGEGLTQAISRLTGANLSPDASVGELIKAMSDAGLKPENFEGVLQDPSAGFEMLSGADPSAKVGKFFLQASEKMSGKTALSPFMLKKGAVLKWVTKTASKQLVKTAVGAKMAPFIAPISNFILYPAIASIPAFLTVAALRKFKKNRKKLILEMIQVLSDIPSVSPDSPVVKAAEEIENNDISSETVTPDADFKTDELPLPSETVPGEDGDGGGAEGCEQTEIGLAKFMKDYSIKTDWSTTAGDGKPKKMSTMFDRKGKLKKNYNELSNEKLQADIESTATAYNELINNKNMFDVSEDADEVAQKVKGIADSFSRQGEMLSERWSKLAGIL
jgi:hypothetical protein